MTDIKITSHTLSVEKCVGGVCSATPGYEIKCVFTIENKEPRKHVAAWWSIHDHTADKRLESGTSPLSPGSTTSVLRYVTMPNTPIKLGFWTGYVDDGGVWRYTDYVKYATIVPIVAPKKGTIIISSFPFGAKAYVDAAYVGETPIVVPRDAGRYMVLVTKDGYVDPPVQIVIVAPGAAANAPFILMTEVAVPKICLPYISGISVPDKIPVSLPSIGAMPTVDVTSFPVSFSVGGSCPSSQFPLDIILSVAGQEIRGSATQGSNRIDIASTVKSVLQGKSFDELAGMTGIAISLKYPSKIEYSSPGTAKEWKEVYAYTRLDVSDMRQPVIPDLCAGVTCENICIGANLYSQKCVNGVCVHDALITANCPDCPGYVPSDLCAGVTCENICIGANLYSQKCVNGVCVHDALITANCPDCPGYVPPSPALKQRTVRIATPMITRVGKKTDVVAFVYVDKEKSSGEEALVTINGGTLTTTRTRDGKVDVSWTPVEPGLYTICVTVASTSASTYIRVVSELSPPEIEAAEEEFEKAKERIGEVMERI